MPRLKNAVLVPLGALLCFACGRANVAGLSVPTPADKNDGGVTNNQGMDATVRDSGPSTVRDSGPGFPPPRDAGPMTPFDAGEVDAGTPRDAGPGRDAGFPRDAGPPRDAGFPRDGGPPPPDGGVECLSNADCSGIGPLDYCDLSTFTCVECLTDMHCSFNGICDPTGFICRPPCFNGNCRPGQVCDPAINACVDCLSNNDCDADEVCHSVIRDCVECETNAHCALAPGQPFCAPGDWECVGCVTDSDCPMGEQCYDYQRGFCAPQTGRSICTPCIADGECGGSGDLCIGYQSTGGLFDRSCSPGCTTDSDCPRGWDCVSVRGGSVDVCRPRYAMQTPTCTAERNLGEACNINAGSVDPGCGLSGVQDARCLMSPTGAAAVCTIWCNSNDQCPTGTSCQMTGGNVGACF